MVKGGSLGQRVKGELNLRLTHVDQELHGGCEKEVIVGQNRDRITRDRKVGARKWGMVG